MKSFSFIVSLDLPCFAKQMYKKSKAKNIKEMRVERRPTQVHIFVIAFACLFCKSISGREIISIIFNLETLGSIFRKRSLNFYAFSMLQFIHPSVQPFNLASPSAKKRYALMMQTITTCATNFIYFNVPFYEESYTSRKSS